MARVTQVRVSEQQHALCIRGHYKVQNGIKYWFRKNKLYKFREPLEPLHFYFILERKDGDVLYSEEAFFKSFVMGKDIRKVQLENIDIVNKKKRIVMNEKTKLQPFRIHPTDLSRFKEVCDENDDNMSRVVRRLIREYINQHDKPKVEKR